MPFEAQIAAAVASALSLPEEEILSALQQTPGVEMGDYTVACFRFAKALRKSPHAIAEAAACSVLPEGVIRAQAVNGYANFFVDRGLMAKETVSDVLDKKERYGAKDLGRGRTVCIDYSSINIAKPFHIGHLSSTAIGHALYNIYNFMGYKSVGINHLGDWGTQFGKLLTALFHWGSERQITDGGIATMLELYVRFHKEAEDDPALEDEARLWFKRIEQGDPEATRLFTLFKDITLKEVMKIYDMLGIRFDSYAGESFYNDKMQPIVDELKAKGLLEESRGAYVVDLSKYDMPPCMILKSDGATLYATRDIAAAFYRKKTYDFAKCLYVVAYQQNLHFRQWFKTVDLMGYEWAKDLEHVAFGMVSLEEGGTLSTRRGNVVLLQDVLNSAIERAKEIIREKSPELTDPDEVAKQVGVGAVVFSVLYNARIKDISFSYDKVLSFDGETAPYVQYTHARCCSVLKKAGDLQADADYSALGEGFAYPVIRLLASYPASIEQALEKNEPYMLTRHIVALAQAYNRFYYEVRILDAQDKGAARAYVEMTDAVKTVIGSGLDLLGIRAPERM